MAGKLIEYPFDTVKVCSLRWQWADGQVRLQTQGDMKPLQFKGPLDCFRQTFQHEGVLGFYKVPLRFPLVFHLTDSQGLSPPLLGAMAENAALFLTYNRAQSFFKSSGLFLSPHSSDTLTISGLVAAGAISGACTSYVLTPIELIKCKLQVQNVGSYTPATTTIPSVSPSTTSSAMLKRSIPATSAALHTSSKPVNNPGPIQLIRDIYRAQGLTGFWRGQMGTFLRETGGSAAWFGTYEYVSSFLRSRRSQQDLPATDLMLAGGCAGMAYNLVLFPADSIKSCMQTDSISEVGGRGRGFWDVGREMWAYGGVRVFYRGCLITVLRAAPSSAVIFWSYENLKRMAL